MAAGGHTGGHKLRGSVLRPTSSGRARSGAIKIKFGAAFRCIKTTVRVGPDGSVLVETVDRLEEALGWVAQFKGKTSLEFVEA